MTLQMLSAMLEFIVVKKYRDVVNFLSDFIKSLFRLLSNIAYTVRENCENYELVFSSVTEAIALLIFKKSLNHIGCKSIMTHLLF